MQRLVYVLFQLDEARRYIGDGRLERLRLALLLLDNAVEIQLDRQVQADLMHEDMEERLRERVLEIPESERPESLRTVAEWEPLSRIQKAKINRLFDEKVHYLAERKSYFDWRLAEPMKYLHRYRNEAYHNARVRKETIRTAAVLLLEINCQLLLTLKGGGTSYASNEDYSWIEERFGRSPMKVFGSSDAIREIAGSLRADVLPSDESVATALLEHLESRFEDFYETLDVIVSNTAISDREAALKNSQYSFNVKQGKLDFRRTPIEQFCGPFTLIAVEDLRKLIANIRFSVGRLEAFHAFSTIESRFEPIERVVYELASEVDHWIQMEIDRMRGK
jgi:hypothetical protein